MSKAIVLSRFNPSPTGHGGNHRSYQILHDVQSVLGEDRIIPLSHEKWGKQNNQKPFTLQNIPLTLKRIINKRIENPYTLFFKTPFVLSNYLPKHIIKEYKQLILDHQPVLCIMEDARYSSLLNINLHYHIPSICVPQNLESLDSSAFEPSLGWRFNKVGIDLINELRALSMFDESFFISKVETGFVGGMGISAKHYPYLPVGKIKEDLTNIRSRRILETVDPNLFLMIGSSVHQSTREAFLWFLNNARTNRLPDGVEIIVCGKGTETFVLPGEKIPGVQIKGWVEQPELTKLLIRANAVLIPQFRGFGSLTRLSELSCAGIPTIVSPHPIYAVGQPPGCQVVGNQWNEWTKMISSKQKFPTVVSKIAYQEWESLQANPLKKNLSLIFNENGS